MQNSYNLEGGSDDIEQALSAAFYGDKSAIFNSSFMSYQDTLFAAKGRHYFKDMLCYIQGDVDFIFGSGQSYFEVKHRHTFLLFNLFWFNYIFVSTNVILFSFHPYDFTLCRIV